LKRFISPPCVFLFIQIILQDLFPSFCKVVKCFLAKSFPLNKSQQEEKRKHKNGCKTVKIRNWKSSDKRNWELMIKVEMVNGVV
jgi:hypothetical protein